MTNNGWIGVDLDGTLAHYDGWIAPDHIGEPIKPILDLVKQWVADGQEVRIFTARVSEDPYDEARIAIQEWCKRHIGKQLPITHQKDYSMVMLYDDRCRQVITNTGEIVGGGL